MTKPVIICPYVTDEEPQLLKSKLGYKLDCFFWKDVGRIGSDLAYEYCWKQFPDRDVIILHTDMEPLSDEWYGQLCKYADKYPEAGILGMKLLYPVETENKLRILQNTGGKFTDDGEAVHIVGNLDLYSGRAFGAVEEDRGQYDHVASVPWQTFGGIYIKRQLLDQLNEFDRRYFWSYYRDVDYCLEARKLGWKIYHTPVPFLHFEGKVNKQIQQQDPAKGHMATLNKQIFWEKWQGSELTKNFYEVVS